MSAPIIVTALFGDADHGWLNGLRRAHFPPERNHLPAHLTLFHHLPPSAAGEVTAMLKRLTQEPAPPARLERLISLGRGVAFLVASPDLAAMRAELADAFTGLLTPQDQAGWRPHVTVQNKVAPADARALLAQLEGDFTPRPLAIAGLAAWWYRGGPWEPIAAFRFGQGHRMEPPRMPARSA
jgi:hypothetical protein